MENTNGGKKLIIILVAVVLVAAVLAIWFSLGNPSAPVSSTPNQLSFSEAQKANGQAALDVPDQFPGNIVYVSRVNFPAGGFVVIRKSNDGQPGAVIGSTFFDKDTRIGNVDLSELLVDGQNYIAQGWTDDSDAVFSETLDKMIILPGDSIPLQVRFKATKDLPERKG